MDFSHEYWMNLALEEAKKAALEDEIPVGAILVKENKLICSVHNKTKQMQNPLAHAEKLLIDQIISKDKYLYDYSLYVTLEPCLMCAGMIISSRLGTLIYGTEDPKAGACASIYNVLYDKSFNHHPKLIRGILRDDCATLLKEFFRQKRNIKK